MQPQLMSMGLTLGVHSMTRVLIVFKFKVTHLFQNIRTLVVECTPKVNPIDMSCGCIVVALKI